MSTRLIELSAIDELEGISLVRAMRQRRSVREYKKGDLTWRQIGQLAWAAQGVTDEASALHTAPSAGALYPVELDIATQNGLFRYQPASHAALQRTAVDIRVQLARAAYEQNWLTNASCVFAIVAFQNRTARKYGARAQRYIQLEAGHVAQNVLLMAAGLGLGATPVGAFNDDAVARALALGKEETPLYLVPIGWPAIASP